jgi:Xaa-Pro aminopeptidase
MKKYLRLLVLLLFITGCSNPGGRSWMIPVTIDPTDLDYTPTDMEGFAKRRMQLADSLGYGYAILNSVDPSSYNRHEFRPNNYFYYLTGYDGPRSFAILHGGPEPSFVLSVPPQSMRSLIYEGHELSAEELQDAFGPDRVISYRESLDLIDSIVKSGATVWTDRSDRDFLALLDRMSGTGASRYFSHIGELVDPMRVLKTSMEVERLQKACNITALALTNVMKQCRPGMYEFEMESVIEGTFLEYGSSMPGFASIVGSGPNSTILHYEANRIRRTPSHGYRGRIRLLYGRYHPDRPRERKIH